MAHFSTSSFAQAVTCFACLFICKVLPAQPKPESFPVEPEDSIELIHVPEGFEVELVVAEPDVIDPVAFTWGPDGRLWVAEMSDYPSGMDGEGMPGGRIRWLKDANGDGRYEESVIFAEHLSYPTGVLPWKQGVLVTAAPMILYLADTDGDGASDKQEVLFDGFYEGNQQLRVNGLIRGLDNWIYCASGAHRSGYGGDSVVISMKTGERIPLGSRDFRFHPETGELQPLSGPSQFGRNRDDWGNWFGVMNSYPVWHYVLEDHYLSRNPHSAAPDPRKQLMLPRNPKVYPFKEIQKRFHNYQEAGRFTSACGTMIYRDGLLFPDSDLETLDIFICEPFGNLVQHNRSFPEGVSFTVSVDGPVEEGRVDFFASKDRWSRPVMARTGPDGALWIADMYRYMIEHPQWLPEAGKEELKPFYRLGDDRGRIYRVFRKEDGLRPSTPLTQMTSQELVATLENRNGLQRDNAQAMLVVRKDEAVVAELSELAMRSESPLARLHALWTLECMGALDTAILKHALSDPSAGIRRHAVRLSEIRAKKDPDLQNLLLGLVNDKDAKVRLQLAYTLGEWSRASVENALGRLAYRDGDDPFMAAAIKSSLNETNLADVIQSLLAERKKAGKGGDLLGDSLALAVAFEKGSTVLSALDVLVEADQDTSWLYAVVTTLLDALERQPEVTSKQNELEEKVTNRIRPLLMSASEQALNNRASESTRKAAIHLMARQQETRSSDIQDLGSLLNVNEAKSIQVAAASRLGELEDERVPDVLMEGWSDYDPIIRQEVLTILGTRVAWILRLLDELEKGTLAQTDLDAGFRQLLLTHSDQRIRDRAEALMPAANVNRLRTVRQYQPALQLVGDTQRGKEVFRNLCIACHRLDGVGLEIGPNLASVTDRNPASLLSGILDPNAVVEGRYRSFLATRKDGRAILGIIASETSTSITMKDLANQEHVILRSDLESLVNTGKSLMPDGLETTLTQQNMADLIAYIAEAE